ncbi:TPA: alanyl-tRNA editing protein [Legionella pneumophila]|jgi:Ser-tRNA(Ala) deacylase AlaX|uniref:Alanyl-tRNA synthetase n=2 Tax=Legionella TaxID=445 RepID=A0A378PHK4_9GAMM|nr:MULTISPECIES: alanyl-tRNA editing protein [Legionella]KTD70733.1 alanyl-tRNA synthetase [Legionella steigerwaltii]MCL9684134.1 alanyl-tRNA editing protein [Legionella maioricensis]MCL9686959.1 alanyl-tRNA editing protein [Legionella maioricensis]OJW10523.1 MAG: alanyl-tRNA editing protein [Legionella sp. 39-23]RYV83387.1 alanyl-tRNA editing protein [Legionella pneumophila]
MQKLFWDNPYQCQLMTKVVSVNENRLLFAEAIGFSFSGGQESDTVLVNGLMVTHSEIENHLIYYTLPSGHGLSEGDVVLMEIDFVRRYKLMRLHFAAELILELVQRMLPIEKIGAHIAEHKARIDFSYQHNISDIFDSLLFEYNQIIAKDMLIRTGFSDEKSQRRYWEIEGFCKVSCGGTHVQSTAEVGFIALKRVNIGSGKERIEIKLLDPNLGLKDESKLHK